MTGAVSSAVASKCVVNPATTAIAANPTGSTSGPRSEPPATLARPSPHPSESPPRTSGKTSHAYSIEPPGAGAGP
jgi:hypothetical protein